MPNKSAAKKSSQKETGYQQPWHGPAIWILVILGSLLLPVMLIALWVKNTLLNTDNYLATIGSLSYHPVVANAIADYTTTQIFQNNQIQEAIKNSLPDNAQFLSLPLTNSLKEFTQTRVYNIVSSDQFNRLWVELNRVIQQQVSNLLLGKSQALVLENGQVVLDVSQIIESIRTSLGREGLGIVEQYAPNLANRQVTLFQAPRLAMWQPYAVAITNLATVLPFVILILFGIALWLSPIKSATLLKIGIGMSVAMILLSSLISSGKTDYLVNALRPPYNLQVATVIYETLTQPLWSSTWLFFIIGGLLAIWSYLLVRRQA